MKQLTIKDAVYWRAEAWEDIKKSSLVKAWNKLIPPPPSPDTTTNSPEDKAPSNKTFVELFNDLGYEIGQSWQAPDACMDR